MTVTLKKFKKKELMDFLIIKERNFGPFTAFPSLLRKQYRILFLEVDRKSSVSKLLLKIRYKNFTELRDVIFLFISYILPKTKN